MSVRNFKFKRITCIKNNAEMSGILFFCFFPSAYDGGLAHRKFKTIVAQRLTKFFGCFSGQITNGQIADDYTYSILVVPIVLLRYQDSVAFVLRTGLGAPAYNLLKIALIFGFTDDFTVFATNNYADAIGFDGVWGDDDGISREFSVHVTSVKVKLPPAKIKPARTKKKSTRTNTRSARKGVR